MPTPYRIESIDLHEIGVFDDLHIDFPPVPDEAADTQLAEIHVFTGPNGCGKSTLLYGLAGIFSLQNNSHLTRRFRSKSSSLDFSFGGFKSKRSFSPFSRIANVPIEYGELKSDINIHNQVIAAMQSLHTFQNYFDNPTSAKILRPREQMAAFAYSGGKNHIYPKIDGILQEISGHPFDDSLSFHNTVRPEVLLQWIANNRTQSALARADGSDAEADQYDRSLARITGFIRAVCDLELNFRLQRQPLAVVIRQGEVEIDFECLPDGLKSIISWVGDLCVRLEAIPWAVPGDPFSQPVILLLDEVDIHLHPAWQRRILPALQKLLPQGQVFVSTHSPFVVGSVQNAWIYRLPEPGTPGPHVVKAIPSGAGKSYRLILEEVFGINAEFDVETERLLDEFYAARATLLQDHEADPTELLQVAAQVAQRSEEAGHIVAREIRQLQRLTQRELSLA